MAAKRDFSDPECGATSVEYGLIVALIAVVIIMAVSTFGGRYNKGTVQSPPPASQSAG